MTQPGLLDNHSTRDLWPPGFGAWIKIGVVYQKTHRQLSAALKPLDLSVAQFDALANLYRADAISQQELAARLLVTKGNVTGLVNRLTERGWVRRQSDPGDRRAYRLVLTPAGKRIAERALVVQRKLVDEMMGALQVDERAALRELLSRLVVRLDEMR